jgi:hemolysin activation/secretion protein
VLGGGAILPIGDDGLTLNPEYTEVDTSPRSGPGTAQVTGRYERFVVRANYPLIRTRRENLTVSGGFELDNETETTNSFGTVGELNHDRLRIFNAGATYARSLGDTATVNADGQVSIGVSGLGARTKADATASGIPLSRQGSEPDFRKADIHLRLDDQVGDGFDLSAMIRGQASFTGALPAAAEFSLDGTDALSAFSLGSINADSGVTGRLELSRPFASGGAWKALITPYGFAAVGYGHLYDVTAVEVANLHSWSAGGGLRLLFSPGPGGLATTGSVEVSHGHVTAAPGTPVVSTQSTDPTRVTVSVGLHF